MQNVKFTCPLTGAEFNATAEDDGSLSVTNPITGNIENYRIQNNKICIPIGAFDHVPMIDETQAAKMLNVTKQRINFMAKNKQLHSCIIGGRRFYRESDILNYKKQRKTGRPKKEDKNARIDFC